MDRMTAAQRRRVCPRITASTSMDAPSARNSATRLDQPPNITGALSQADKGALAMTLTLTLALALAWERRIQT